MFCVGIPYRFNIFFPICAHVFCHTFNALFSLTHIFYSTSEAFLCNSCQVRKIWFPEFPHFGLSFVLYFCFQVEQFCLFLKVFICVFLGFSEEFINVLCSDIYHIQIGCFNIFRGASASFGYSEPGEETKLGSDEEILSWLDINIFYCLILSFGF